jgi:hypothetical protein
LNVSCQGCSLLGTTCTGDAKSQHSLDHQFKLAAAAILGGKAAALVMKLAPADLPHTLAPCNDMFRLCVAYCRQTLA